MDCGSAGSFDSRVQDVHVPWRRTIDGSSSGDRRGRLGVAISRHGFVFAALLFAGGVLAQAPDADDPARVEIGNGFSVVAPTGMGWQKTAEPASYFRHLDGAGHSLVLAAVTGPSGISAEEIRSIGVGPHSGDRLVKVVTRFVERAWQANAAGVGEGRLERIEVTNDAMGAHDIGKLMCAYSRIRVRDRGAPVDGVPAQLRYVAYACVDLSRMHVAAQVSYSERGREQDLSDQAMADGERFARSLRFAR